MSAGARHRLGDVLRLVDTAVEVETRQTYPLAGIYSFGRGLIDRGALKGSDTKYRTLHRVRAGSVVFARLNAWEGAIAVVPKEFDGYHFLSEFPVLEVDESRCDRAYLRHLLTWPKLWSQLAPRGSMIRRKRTTPATLLAAEVPLPPIGDQRRVARKLDRMLDAVASSERSEALASALRESLLRTVFPRGGTCNSIGELLELARTRIEIDADKSYRSIGIRSFGKGMIYYPESKGGDLSKLRYYRFPPNALAVSNIKAWEGAVSVSPESTDQFIASNRFLFYLPKKRTVDVRYISYYLISPAGLAQVGRASPGSADRNRTLSIERFDEVAVPIPSIEEQRRAVAVLERAFGELVRLDERRSQLRQALRHSALNAVFTREL